METFKYNRGKKILCKYRNTFWLNRPWTPKLLWRYIAHVQISSRVLWRKGAAAVSVSAPLSEADSCLCVLGFVRPWMNSPLCAGAVTEQSTEPGSRPEQDLFYSSWSSTPLPSRFRLSPGSQPWPNYRVTSGSCWSKFVLIQFYAVKKTVEPI